MPQHRVTERDVDQYLGLSGRQAVTEQDVDDYLARSSRPGLLRRIGGGALERLRAGGRRSARAGSGLVQAGLRTVAGAAELAELSAPRRYSEDIEESMRTGEPLPAIPGPGRIGPRIAEGARGLIERERERIGPPEGWRDVATDVGSTLVGEGLQYLIPGKALGLTSTAGRLLAGAPVDLAIGAAAPETSTAGALAHVLRGRSDDWADRFERIAADPGKRAVFEALVGTTAAGLIEAPFAIRRAGQRAAGREAERIGEGLTEGARLAEQDLEPRMVGGMPSLRARERAAELERMAARPALPYPGGDPGLARELAAQAAEAGPRTLERRARGERGPLPAQADVATERAERLRLEELLRRAEEARVSTPDRPQLPRPAGPEPGLVRPPAGRTIGARPDVSVERPIGGRPTPSETGRPLITALHPLQPGEIDVPVTIGGRGERPRPPEPTIEPVAPREEPRQFAPEAPLAARAAPRATDLFGEPVEEVVRQAEMFTGGQRLSDAEANARETVRRLHEMVESGDATPAEMVRYDEAVALLRRGERVSAEEMATRAVRTARETGEVSDFDTVWQRATSATEPDAIEAAVRQMDREQVELGLKRLGRAGPAQQPLKRALKDRARAFEDVEDAVFRLTIDEARHEGEQLRSVRLKYDFGGKSGGAVGTGVGAYTRGRIRAAKKKLEAAQQTLALNTEVDTDLAFLASARRRMAGRTPETVPLKVSQEIEGLQQLTDDEILGRIRHLEDNVLPRFRDDPGEVGRWTVLRAEAKTRGLLRQQPGRVSPELLNIMGRTLLGAGIGAPIGAASAEDEQKLPAALKGAAIGAGLAVLQPATRALIASERFAGFYRRTFDVTDPLIRAERKVRPGPDPGPLHKAVGHAHGYEASASHHAFKNLKPIAEEFAGLGKQGARDARDLLQAERTLELHAIGERKRAELAAARTALRQAQNAARRKQPPKGARRALRQARARVQDARRAVRNAKEATPQQLARSQATIARLQGNAPIQQVVGRVRSYYRDLLTMKRDAGVLTPEAYNDIVSQGLYYTPMIPEGVPVKTRGLFGRPGRFAQTGTGVRRLRGARITDEPVDPLAQAMIDTRETFRRVRKQQVANEFGEMVRQHPQQLADMGVTRIPLNTPVTGRRVESIVNGNRVAFEFSENGEALFDAFAGFDPSTKNVYLNVLRASKRVLHKGVTLAVDFMARNLLRDTWQVAVQYPFVMSRLAGSSALGAGAGAVVSEDKARGAMRGAAVGAGLHFMGPQFARMLRAMRHLTRQDAVFDEYMQAGAAMFGGFYDRKGAERVMHEWLGERTARDWLAAPLDGLNYLGWLSENVNRLARFETARKAGKDLGEATLLARDSSLDYARFGKDLRTWGDITEFFRARLLGWDKLARMVKDPKVAFASTAAITAPTIALWDLNKDDEKYRDTPLYIRTMFWMVPRGRDQETGETQFLYIPKPFELGFLFASVPELLADYAYRRDPESLKAGLTDITRTTTEGAIAFPGVLENVAVELPLGKDLFRRRDIETREMQGLPRSGRFDERTSNVAIALERVIPGEQSPAKLDFLLRARLGGLGRQAMGVVDWAARELGVDLRPATTEQRGLLGTATGLSSFVDKPYGVGEAEHQIRRRSKAAEERYNDVRKRIEAYQRAAELGVGPERLDRMRAGVQDYMKKHLDDLVAREPLRNQMRLIDKAATKRREIREDPRIDAATKRRLIGVVNTALRRVLLEN